MARIYVLLLCLCVSIGSVAQKAKYVFLMIGDGMGVNQINLTERYRAAMNGSNCRVPLCMTSFPVTGLSYTYSKSHGTTDSAAGGTALSAGEKTTNGTIAMDSAKANPIETVAELAKKRGMAVGVTTSVSIDHATPAVFYAHVPERGMYYEIGKQLATSNFDFFGGAWFHKPKGDDGKQPALEDIVTKAGYTTLKGYDEYLRKGRKQKKVILTQTDDREELFRNQLPCALDRNATDLQLPQITEAAVDFLYNKGKEKGFFLMVEGGQIDYACHGNDAAAAIHEVVDFDNAIAVAYNFYKQHPDETLIVISADHETGGITVGRDNNYDLHLDVLGNQKCSQNTLTKKLLAKLEENKDAFTFDVMKLMVAEHTGLWTSVKMDEKDEAEMKEAYDRTMQGKADGVKSEYYVDNLMATAAIRILNRKAVVGWTTGGHTSGFVPVFAVGMGANRFAGVIENNEIEKRIAELLK